MLPLSGSAPHKHQPARRLPLAAEKLEAADAELAHSGRMGRFAAPFDKRGKDDQKLGKLTRDTGRLAVEQIKGISSQVCCTSA